MSLTCNFGAVEEWIVESLARLTQIDIDNNWYFIFILMNLDGCPVGGQKNIDNNLMLWDISMPTISSLWMEIGRRRNKWHPTVFEVEGECNLQGSWNSYVWSIMMHVNICQVIWGVEIWWDQQMVVHRRKKGFLMWNLIF